MSRMTEIWMKSMPTIATKFGIFYILTFLLCDIVMDIWNLGEKSLSKWQKITNIANLKNPNFYFFTRNRQTMLGFHLVLMTLHGLFTTTIEQDK